MLMDGLPKRNQSVWNISKEQYGNATFWPRCTTLQLHGSQLASSATLSIRVRRTDEEREQFQRRTFLRAARARLQTVSQQDNDCNSGWTASEWLAAKNANISEQPSRSLNLIRAPRKKIWKPNCSASSLERRKGAKSKKSFYAQNNPTSDRETEQI